MAALPLFGHVPTESVRDTGLAKFPGGDSRGRVWPLAWLDLFWESSVGLSFSI